MITLLGLLKETTTIKENKLQKSLFFAIFLINDFTIS